MIMQHVTAAVAMLLMSGLAGAATNDLDMRFRQVLLDESVVAGTAGVERVYGEFRPSGVRLITVTEPVERGYVGRIGGAKVIYDANTGRYQMWYQTITRLPDGSGGRTGIELYAESDDALQWRKPHLFNLDWRGDGKKNNIVHHPNFGSIVRMPDGRLAGFANGHATEVFLLGDGRRIEGTFGQRLTGIPNSQRLRAQYGRFNTDTYNINYDPVTRRYLGMIKTYSQLEESDDPKLWRRAVAPAVGNDGSSWRFWGLVLGVDRQDEARLRSLPYLADEKVARRGFGPMAPFNQEDYARHRPADHTPATELHDLMHFRYEGLYLGFRNHLYRYHIAAGNRAGQPAGNYGEHNSEYFLTWSHDFERWIRPEHRLPLFPTPEIGSDQFGMYRLCWPCLLRRGDALWLFYHVPVGYGNGPPVPPHEQWISYATLRVDGWAGYRAPMAGGTVETVPFLADGVLRVNVDAGARGSLRVEVRDDQGRTLPGFSQADCHSITGDSPAAVPGWTRGKQWQELAGRRVRLRFHLTAATVYSFWTRDDDEIIGLQSTPPPGRR